LGAESYALKGVFIGKKYAMTPISIRTTVKVKNKGTM
jgi:hypothetical protein